MDAKYGSVSRNPVGLADEQPPHIEELSPLQGESSQNRALVGDFPKVNRLTVCLVAGLVVLLLVGAFVLDPESTRTPGLDELGAGLEGLEHDHRHPFSLLNPVDLGFSSFSRPVASMPSRVLSNFKGSPLPTNSWYQSLLMADEQPSNIHRAYVIPYVVDAAGPIPGLRVHANHISASSTVVQLNIVEDFAITLGVSSDKGLTDYRYKATDMTNLGLSLTWVSINFKIHSMPR